VEARIERIWSPRVGEREVLTDDGEHEVGVSEAVEANAWLIGDDEEVIVVDPGEDAASVLEQVGDREILAVICTHGHASHVAAAIEVAERDEAQVALHRADRLLWRAVHDGDDPEIEMADGGLFDVADVQLEVIHTPGHTPGHVCFIDEDSRRLFSGDHILPRITPNISLNQFDAEGPLAQYLRSLAKVRDLETSEVMPAHEWRFRGLAERVDGIAAHHERRLEELLAAIVAHPDSTSWFLASQLTWSRSWDQYNGFLRVSAVTETAAHVVELVERGLVTSSGGDVPGYRVVG